MKLFELLFVICLVLVLFCNFTEKGRLDLKVSFIQTKTLSEKGGQLSGEEVFPDKSKLDGTDVNIFRIVQVIDIDDLSQDEDEEDDDEKAAFIDDLEKTEPSQTESEDKDGSTGDEVTDAEEPQADVQNEGESVIDSESKQLGFNPALYFNSHKCFLMVGFEIEFLENPILSKSGIVRYIKEAEVDSEGNTVEKNVSPEADKYKLIELETRNKKLEDIVSLMKHIKNFCWNITSETTLKEFKEEVLEIIEVIQSKIHQINVKLERYINITDQQSPEFEPSSYEQNMEKKSRLQGRKNSFQLALASFRRIEEYWTHLENLPSL